MKIKKSEITSETIGKTLFEESFSIGNVGRIMTILRNTMYSNPIQSIIREISCNARDAHREIGTPDRPIKITLPTRIKPIFSIKDYGPGISPQRMADVFIRYGKSTKNEDNIQTGGFGLGAKTPFAYRDQFNIITITKEESSNVKRIYTAYIDESEEGKIRLVMECNSDEETGTEIEIHVELKDINTFIEQTCHSLQYFKVKPKVNNTDVKIFWENNGDISERQIIYKSENGIVNKSIFYGIDVLIDDIMYKINTYNLNLKKEDHLLLKQIEHLNVIIYAENGELSLSANRETLQYDESTNNILLNKIKNIITDFTNFTNEIVNECKFENEGCNILNAVHRGRLNQSIINNGYYNWRGNYLCCINTIPFHSTIKNILSASYNMYKDKIVFSNIKNDYNQRYEVPVSTNKYFIINDLKKVPRAVISKYVCDEYIELKNNKKEILTKLNISSSDDIMYRYKLQYKDLPEDYKFLLKNNCPPSYQIISYDNKQHTVDDIVEFLKKNFDKKTETINFIKTSDILKKYNDKNNTSNIAGIKKEKAPRVKKDLHVGRFYKINNDGTLKNAELTKYPDSGVLLTSKIKTEKYECVNNKTLLFFNEEIYYIKQEYYDKIKDKIKIKLLDEYIDNKLKEINISKEQAIDFIKNNKHYINNNNHFVYNFCKKIPIDDIINKNNQLFKDIKELKEQIQYFQENKRTIYALLEIYNINYRDLIYHGDYTNKIHSNIKENIDNNYPLIVATVCNTPYKQFVDYINGIDLLKGKENE
jgi:hypothetical protein